MSGLIDCPALHERRTDYPFGDRVPHTVRMRKTVAADVPMFGYPAGGDGAPRLALISQLLPAWTNSHGAVSVVLRDGKRLGVKPDEFEVAEWHLPSTGGDSPAPIDIFDLMKAVAAARRRFLNNNPAAPAMIVFPEIQREQPVVWYSMFPKQERRTDPLGACAMLYGMTVRFSGDVLEAVCR
jgi:hypothetical protein